MLLVERQVKVNMKRTDDLKWTGGQGPAWDDHRVSLGVSKAVEPIAQSREEMADETGSGSHTN